MAKRLHSLNVDSFRALNSLHISALADVNLIVGKNSAGKTTVLEALRLLFTSDVRTQIYSILSDREEWAIKRWLSPEPSGYSQSPEVSVESLFSGRPNLSSKPRFRIAGAEGERELTLRFEWLRVERGDDASVRYLPSPGPEHEDEAIPALRVFEGDTNLVVPLDRFNRMIARRSSRTLPETGMVFLSSTGMSMQEVGRMWDSVALTDDEDHVVEALRIIAPSLEKLVMVQSPDPRAERLLMAKVAQFRTPIPFKSLGEGAMHLLSVTLGIIQARNSILLIDEIASGVHYSVQGKLWRLVFEQVKNHNIQVFATTHSFDCIRALHRAAGELSGLDATLHRLEADGMSSRSVSFSTNEIAIADYEDIEVR